MPDQYIMRQVSSYVVPLSLVMLSCLVFTMESRGQLNRREIKRNNHKMYTYRGEKKVKFGSDKQYKSIGLSLDVFNYYGDLSPTAKRISTDLTLTKPGVGFFYAKRIGPRTSIQGTFTYGTVTGSDRESADKNDLQNGIFRYNRNLSFRNRIKEFALTFHVDYFQNSSAAFERVSWTPYMVLGGGVFYHNPQAKAPLTDLHGNPLRQGGEWVNLQPLGTEGQNIRNRKGFINNGIKPYKLIQPALIFGFGARMRISDNIDITTEIALRYLFTDYLDDVSTNYVDLGLFDDNELAKAMSYRSNEISRPTYRYVSEHDGKSYNVLPGYGYEHKENMRGQKKDRDIYSVLTVRVAYVLENYHHRRPKYR